MTITTTRLYQIISDKLGKETAESLTTFIKEDVSEEIENKTNLFLTKDDKVDLLKEIYSVRTDLEKSIRQHLYWTVGIGLLILTALISFSVTILSRLSHTV